MKRLVGRSSPRSSLRCLPRRSPSAGGATEEEFDPSHEFELHAWVPIEIGPLDLSINKAVVYLFLGGALTIVLGICAHALRAARPARHAPDDRRDDLRDRADPDRRAGPAAQGDRPLVPVRGDAVHLHLDVNMVGFIPLPLSDETFELAGVDLPRSGIYAATSSHLRSRSPSR